MKRRKDVQIPVRNIPHPLLPSIIPCLLYTQRLCPHQDTERHVVPYCRLALLPSNTRLVQHLATHGYIPVAHTAGFLTHVIAPCHVLLSECQRLWHGLSMLTKQMTIMLGIDE